uniref:Uncharacterized protein n=1 Tax=Timema bartmani TaxID=61472 RepID=A0A7R9I874_9NEOP|nr:unnamed protein product [Timema bartmani]
MATGGGPTRNSVVGEEIIAQVMSIIPGLDEKVDCWDSDFFHQQRANLSRVSTANSIPITRPVSFPTSVTTATLVSFATSPPISIQTFPLSHPLVSLPSPSGSFSQLLQWFPTSEENPASVSRDPSRQAEKMFQTQGNRTVARIWRGFRDGCPRRLDDRRSKLPSLNIDVRRMGFVEYGELSEFIPVSTFKNTLG